MIARLGSGWQTILADLSLILFMVTAGVLGHSQPQLPVVTPQPSPSEQGEPLAVWQAEPGAPPIAAWLAEQPADRRLLLTVVARYGAGQRAVAAARALTLAGEAGAVGARARIVVEPGGEALIASLAYDVPVQATGASLAQGLLPAALIPPVPETTP